MGRDPEMCDLCAAAATRLKIFGFILPANPSCNGTLFRDSRGVNTILFTKLNIGTLCGLWRMIRDILRPAKRGSEGLPERVRDAPKGRSPAGASLACSLRFACSGWPLGVSPLGAIPRFAHSLGCQSRSPPSSKILCLSLRSRQCIIPFSFFCWQIFCAFFPGLL